MTKEFVRVSSIDTRRSSWQPPPKPSAWARFVARVKEGKEIILICTALCGATYTAITSTVAYLHGLVTAADVKTEVAIAVKSEFEKAKIGEVIGEVVILKNDQGVAADRIQNLRDRTASLEGRYDALIATHQRR